MPASLPQRILEHVRGLDAALIELLRELVEAESPSTHPAVHRRARHTLMAAIGDLGFCVRETGTPASARHVFARPPARDRAAPLQLLVGHYDTVWPVGTVAERPFEVDGNVVRGPGVFDMKGGLAQLVIALRTLRELDLAPPLTPVIFVNADEEIGSRSSTRYLRKLARLAQRAFVLEPAFGEAGRLKTARKGVGRFTVTVFGKAAHAGLDPESGASAILELAHVIRKLFAMNDPDRGITVNVGTVDGGVRPNVVAPNSTAVVDVRVPTIADGERIENAIHGLEPEVPGVRLRVDGTIDRPTMEYTARNRALFELAKDAAAKLGLELEETSVGGASDANTTSRYTATLDGLGAVGHGAHAAHECLYLDRTLERAALLALVLLAPPASGAGTTDRP